MARFAAASSGGADADTVADGLATGECRDTARRLSEPALQPVTATHAQRADAARDATIGRAPRRRTEIIGSVAAAAAAAVAAASAATVRATVAGAVRAAVARAGAVRAGARVVTSGLGVTRVVTAV